jgi:multidrug efflux pump
MSTHQHKEFSITSWAIENKTTVYIFTIILSIAGYIVYSGLPKEKFPDIVVPQIYVSTIYPGTSPEDMENLITKPIEKELKSISGVKKVTSTSIQDFCAVLVEFNSGIEVPVAKQRVTDAVDRAQNELPDDLDKDPQIAEVEFSEFPIMNLNLSGDYPLKQLKEYAEILEDDIEELPEIKRVDIVGALNREIQINVNLYKAQAAGISLGEIERTVASENVNISGGELSLNDVRRTLRVTGEIKKLETLRNLIVRGSRGQAVFLRDIAEIKDGFEEKQDFARLDGKPVISLNVIKRGGQNLISAADAIEEIEAKALKSKFPAGLTITRTNDQSESTRTDIQDLINTVILGFIFVVFVLMFFMGTTDALFVGLSVPLSALIAFIPMVWLGFSLNVVVMFAFLLGLGIVVDDAIVVIENTHRIFNNDPNISIKDAAKRAAGEVFLPVLSGTLVNIAPFFPLLFWPGILGEFMKYLPSTLILTLFASLFVAFVINPVFAVSFMKRHSELHEPANVKKGVRRFWLISGSLVVLGAVAFGRALATGTDRTIGTLLLTAGILMLTNKFVLTPLINGFQNSAIPALMRGYKGLIRLFLHRWSAAALILSSLALTVASIMIWGGSNPKVIFFPSGEPNYVNIYLQMPIGTDASLTDSITKTIEEKVRVILEPHEAIVNSVISNVGIGAGDPSAPDRTVTPHKGKVTVAFVPLGERIGISTQAILNQIREEIKGIPGAEISVEKESGGPPVGKPVSIEIAGDDLLMLLKIQNAIKAEIDKQRITGIDQLKSDLQLNKPEIVVDINREKAAREGISTAQIAIEIRTALFGKEVSQYREAKDEYPIMLRLSDQYRNKLDQLVNQPITYLDMATGGPRQIPISAVADVHYATTYSSINRKNQTRVVTLGSDVVPGANANAINEQIRTKVFPSLKLEEGYSVRLGGEQEDQKETQDFLSVAFLTAVGLMFMILVTQFNSLSKPFITFATIAFSWIGVFLGFYLFKGSFSIIFSGVGIIALAGIVVKNGIILIEFIEVLRERGYSLRDAIIEGGATRMTPVLLTASAAILGLVPLALGININFGRLLSEGDADFYLGGESSVFWGPLAWTMIYGLVVSTFLTLVVAPSMYYLNERFGERFMGRKQKEVTPLIIAPENPKIITQL